MSDDVKLISQIRFSMSICRSLIGYQYRHPIELIRTYQNVHRMMFQYRTASGSWSRPYGTFDSRSVSMEVEELLWIFIEQKIEDENSTSQWDASIDSAILGRSRKIYAWFFREQNGAAVQIVRSISKVTSPIEEGPLICLAESGSFCQEPQLKRLNVV